LVCIGMRKDKVKVLKIDVFYDLADLLSFQLVVTNLTCLITNRLKTYGLIIQ